MLYAVLFENFDKSLNIKERNGHDLKVIPSINSRIA